jgi:type IV pilus assembly protein PilQ
VEPKFTAKNEPANPPVEPAVRAQAAAGRFADKTAAELVALNTHATMKQDAASGSAPAIQPAVNLAAEQKAQMAQPPAASGSKYTGEPISVNLKDVDLKDFFRLIHEISGLNVVLDPNVKGTLTIVLDDVPWDQALDIVLKNNDLSRQLEGNILRIATIETLKKEAENRRAQIDAEALAVDKVTITRFLSYAHSKDVVPTLKKFISQRGDLVADDRTNSLIISDIPASLPQIDRIIQQMDRKTQEVEIEARVVAATRAFARDIGTQLGFGWGNGPSAVGGVQNVGTTPTTIGTGFVPNPLYILSSGSSTTGTQIPLFSNLGATGPTSGLQFVNATNNMRIDFLLTMAESRGLLKVLSRPRVVTQNNIQAVVKQGVRVPVTTQAQLGGPPTVTYVDAFLRLTVTPQITSEGTIFLNVDVENTLPDFGNVVQGNPTLITQQATTQVLVTDGGTVVIGGVIQTQNSLSIAQVPLLGDIPYLGNLFKHRAVKTSDQELIFFITPRIIQT